MVSLAAPLLEVSQVSKAYPGVQALREVQLQLLPGEVLGVVGENGAGKSTLMKILAGVVLPDSGEILWSGKPAEIHSVESAEKLGIVLIHQELNLANNLDIAGNLFLGREMTWGGPLRLLDRRMEHQAAELTARVGLQASPRTPVSSLSAGQQQLVEIARALSLRSRVLIMDEPTSSLTQHETDRLYQVIRDLKREGVSILYISHRLKEIEEIADRVVVLRDGQNAGELAKSEIRHENLVRLMVGRELKQFFQRTVSEVSMASPVVLRAKGVQLTGVRHAGPMDFEIRAGEIVGLAGLMGAGRTELAESLFGIRRLAAGKTEMAGRPLDVRTPRQAISAGLFLVPEDRRSQGLILMASVLNNISLASLEQLQTLRIVALRRERELAEQMCHQLRIRTPDVRQAVGLLSGGNQQKVVLAKWLTRMPKLLILDEPTRGVDVGAKSEIYGLMDQLANRGVGILMISSDLEEILGMSDRILVMHEGRMSGELAKSAATEEAIMRLATGVA